MYEQNLEDNALRRVIEQTVSNMIAAGVGGLALPERWANLQQRLELPQAEQDALAQMQRATEADEYLSAVEGLASFELKQAAGVPVEFSEHMRAARLGATIRRFEETGSTKIASDFVAETV